MLHKLLHILLQLIAHVHIDVYTTVTKCINVCMLMIKKQKCEERLALWISKYKSEKQSYLQLCHKQNLNPVGERTAYYLFKWLLDAVNSSFSCAKLSLIQINVLQRINFSTARLARWNTPRQTGWEM